MKKIILILMLFFMSLNISYANWTSIFTDSACQCNNWGWIGDMFGVLWKNPCTPLSVLGKNGELISVPSTESVCKEDEIARYHFYSNQEDSIKFEGCFSQNEKANNIFL